ncbi:hypothetical protein CB0940_05322 [Cercospora beticola]|nr:hypothetical protein CB0940_05322 [Cercospora beticola]PIA97306.1 hypothetical protein CB0940_05322 [Cercospora beticola]
MCKVYAQVLLLNSGSSHRILILLESRGDVASPGRFWRSAVYRSTFYTILQIFKQLYSIENAQLVTATAGILRSDKIDFEAFSKQLSAGLEDSSDLFAYNSSLATRLRSMHLADEAAFVRLEAQQCLDVYGSDLLTEHSHVFAIVDPSVKVNETDSDRSGEYSDVLNWADLGISGAAAENTPMYWPSSISDLVHETQRDSHSHSWLLSGKYLEYCMAKREPGHCKVQFSTYILVGIIVCNFIKMSVMVWHLWHQRSGSLVTFGDALASWLQDVDDNTMGNCLIDKSSVRDEREDRFDQLATQPQKRSLVRRGYLQPSALGQKARKPTKKRRWAAAVDIEQWVPSLAICIVSLCAAAFFLIRATRDPERLSIQEAIAAGKFFVEDTTSTLETKLPTNGTKGFIASVLLVKTPQIVLSCCYLGFNGLLTSMHLAYEFSGYAIVRKGLRVTEPRGTQRTTYWLQLPFKYSLPLLVTTALLHWLISQSLFLVRVVPYRAGFGAQTIEPLVADESGVGISLVPMLVAVVLAFCLLLIVVGLGFRKLASNMPIAGSCSFALATAVHRPQEDEKASTLPLMWGEIPRMGTQELGHCSFTSEEVVELEPNRKYAGCRQGLTA